MRKLAIAAAAATLLAFGAKATDFEVGVGANYWYSLHDAVEESFDEDGLGWMLSTRIMFTDYIGIGLEVEKSPDNYVKLDEPMYAPAAYAILGDWIYASVGVGTYFYDGEFVSDTWYALRAGLKFHIVSPLVIDINCNYRVDNWDDMGHVKDDIDSDSVILGAAVRLAF